MTCPPYFICPYNTESPDHLKIIRGFIHQLTNPLYQFDFKIFIYIEEAKSEISEKFIRLFRNFFRMLLDRHAFKTKEELNHACVTSASFGNYTNVIRLLKIGADPNYLHERDGWGALHYAGLFICK